MKRKISLSAAIILIVAGAFLSFAATYLYMSVSAGEKSKLDEAMDVINKYYVGDYAQKDVEDSAVAGMISALGDRWSYYLTAEELDSYIHSMNNNYSGIGIVIDSSEGKIKIVSVYADSPAAAAGVLPGGSIISVGGESTEGLNSNEVKALVQKYLESGEVVLDIETDGSIASYAIMPGVVEIDPVSFEMLEGEVGYIKIKNFEARCAEQIKKAVSELREQGAQGLVFDVRFNPGGQLNELLSALDYLLPEGVIFISGDKGGELRSEYSDAGCVEMPMTVLVNADSYSAAEFFAAALQEYEWASIVGEQTTGKGYAQSTHILSDGSAIHISTRKYFTPNGVSLAGVGITPDVQIDLSDEEYAALYYGTLDKSEDEQLIAAVRAVKNA